MNTKKLSLLMCAILSFVMMGCLTSFASGWELVDGDWVFLDSHGEIVMDEIKSSNGVKYYIDNEGKMATDYLLEDYNENTYYFDDTGAMVKDTWVAVEPSQVSVPIDNGPTVYLYYFGSNGKAYKASSGCVKKTIDGKKYLFNEQGIMLSGWINSQGEMFNDANSNDDPFLEDYIYYAGDETDGVLREGWMEYVDGSVSDEYYDKEIIWFYFNPTNNKKTRYNGSNGNPYGDYYQKSINGGFYAFDVNGVLLTGWEASIATRYYATEEMSPDDVGRLAKKQWIYAVPSEVMNGGQDYSDDTERWFYASKSGDLVKGIMKKINGHEYVFDDDGIMKSDLVVIDKFTKKFLYNIDTEATDGKRFLTDRAYFDKDTGADIETNPGYGHEEKAFDPSKHILAFFDTVEDDPYFGSRQFGKVTLHFSDTDYDFVSDKNGEYEGYKKKGGRAVYHFGIKLKADPLIGYGLALEKMASPSTPVGDEKQNRRLVTEYRTPSYSEGALGDGNEYHVHWGGKNYISDSAYGTTPHWAPMYRMVSTNGKLMDKGNRAIKDKNNNYWILDNRGYVVRIVSVPVRYTTTSSGPKWQFKSELQMTGKTGWIDCGDPDTYGNTVWIGEYDGNARPYDIAIDEGYMLNFTVVD